MRNVYGDYCFGIKRVNWPPDDDNTITRSVFLASFAGYDDDDRTSETSAEIRRRCTCFIANVVWRPFANSAESLASRHISVGVSRGFEGRLFAGSVSNPKSTTSKTMRVTRQRGNSVFYLKKKKVNVFDGPESSLKRVKNAFVLHRPPSATSVIIRSRLEQIRLSVYIFSLNVPSLEPSHPPGDRVNWPHWQSRRLRESPTVSPRVLAVFSVRFARNYTPRVPLSLLTSLFVRNAGIPRRTVPFPDRVKP